MKKILLICFCLVLLFSLSFVSAGFFGDFLGKITGKAIRECALGGTLQCGTDVGACEFGTQECMEGECDSLSGLCSPNYWSFCIGGTSPVGEICDDGIDNNCDGQIDEGCQTCIDDDGDGVTDCDGDCDDANPNLYPGQSETRCTSNPSVIKEFYCENGDVKSNSPVLCYGDSKCYEGDCRSCIDYDGAPAYIGPNYTVSGITWNQSYTLGDGKEDVCIDNAFLNESFCSSSNILFEEYECSLLGNSYRCQSGACFCAPYFVLDNVYSNETALFVDASECNYESFIEYYDSNDNGIIGDSGCPLGVENVIVEGYLLNSSANYTDTGIKTIELWEQNATAGFNWDFSDVLNLCPVEIEISSPSDPFGYIIIQNLDISNKTVWFDRLNNSNQVCIKDMPGVASVNEFSSNCNATGEVLASCSALGIITSGYNCQIESGQFKVWPLNHSAVVEWVPGGIVGCVADWSCSDWSNVTGQCGTRNCTDLSFCEANKVEDQVCGIQPCVPSWTHSGWGECVDGFKHKTYYDANNCGSLEEKPSDETWECKYQKPITVIILVIVGIILLILGIIYFIKKKKSQELVEGQAPISSSQTYPPSPPVTPRAVQSIPRLPAQPVQ